MTGRKYDDIITRPRHSSEKRPHMPLSGRAAQFSPFAALTGHNEAIKETARLTDRKPELTEEEKAVLNAKLMTIAENIKKSPEAQITYFRPDEKKSGGEYKTEIGPVKKIDEQERKVIMQNGIVINIDNIIAVETAASPFTL